MSHTCSPAEVIKVRTQLGYTVAGFAELLDVSVETVRSWESGRRTCKGPSALIIHLMGVRDWVHDAVLETNEDLKKRRVAGK